MRCFHLGLKVFSKLPKDGRYDASGDRRGEESGLKWTAKSTLFFNLLKCIVCEQPFPACTGELPLGSVSALLS